MRSNSEVSPLYPPTERKRSMVLVIKVLECLVKEKFWGEITISLKNGEIKNVKKVESIKID